MDPDLKQIIPNPTGSGFTTLLQSLSSPHAMSNFVVVSAPGATPSEATSIAVSDNLQLMAVGFESGAVHLYRNMEHGVV